MIKKTTALIFSAALIFFASPANAENEKEALRQADSAIIKEIEEKAIEAQNELSIMLENLQENMNSKQRQHFYMIYTNHNMIETVKTVETDVGTAIKACSKHHDDLKDQITARFAEWKKAVNEKLEEAETQKNNLIHAQDYETPKNIEKILQKSNKVREHSKNIYKKVPVTSKKACEYLHNKMDETQDNMLTLLSTTLISVPQQMQKIPLEEDHGHDHPETEEKEPEEKTSEEL